MSRVCRTCLEEIWNSDCLSLDDPSNRLKEELLACVPELDLDLIPGAAVCVYCASALHSAFSFKQKCLETEQKILSHKHEKQFNLKCIKEEPEIQKFDDIGMEVVFIKDEEQKESKSNHTETQEPVSSFLKVTYDIGRNRKSGAVIPQNESNKTANVPLRKKLKIKRLTRNAIPDSIQQHNGQTFKCTQCPYTSSSEMLVELHSKTHRPRPESRRSSLNTTRAPTEPNPNDKAWPHLTRTKVFKCSTCFYTTTNNTSLTSHVQTHTGEKPYACPYCDYRAIQKVNLQTHMKHHTQQSSFKCPKCSYSASDAATVKKHTAKFHKS